MPLRADVGRVVVQDIEDEMRLVLVGADDARVAWHMVGDQCVGAHAFLQSKVFATVPGIDGVDLGFDALAVAAGMLQIIDVVLVEHGQRGSGIGDLVVAGVQRLRPQKIARRRHKRRVTETGDLRHLPKAHVGPHCDDAGKDMARIGLLFHVTAQDVSKRAQEASLFGNELQEIGNANTRQMAIERTIDGLLFRGIDQRPAALIAGAGDFDVFVLAVLDAPIDALVLFFQFCVQGGERFLDRRQ